MDTTSKKMKMHMSKPTLKSAVEQMNETIERFLETRLDSFTQ